MPTTYNGIGTRYYGEKNAQTRPGPCPHCGRMVELKSYDTRLWFVIVFIPVIPLGRKRIVDYCPACTRHFAADAEKWETAKQLEVSGALDKFKSSPTPEAAIETHQALVNYHEFEQASAFRAKMRHDFAGNATVHAYLGAILTHYGRLDEAAQDFIRALELRPDLPEARIGVAEHHLRNGRPDEARKLLDFLERPGANQLYSLVPLEDLARALQNANRHNEALDLFAKLLAAHPELGQNRNFRKLVARSEKGTRGTSILPKKKFSWRSLFQRDLGATAGGPVFTKPGLIVVGAIVALILVISVFVNFYTKRNRTLFIVSGYAQPARVEVRGHPPVTARAGFTEMKLPEGRYHVSISGPIRQELDFEIRSGYFARWFEDPAWVLNVGGSALYVLQESVYSRNPRRGDVRFQFGQSFMHFAKVTHPFRALPESLRMKEHEERVLTQLQWMDASKGAVPLFYHHLDKHNTNEALRLAEWRLGIEPDDGRMLHAYAGQAVGKLRERAQKFLRSGLTNRPVSIEWHRMFQTLVPGARNSDELTAFYDQMITVEPTNSALLYLRGRLAETSREAQDWYDRALAADTRNAYPRYALAFHHLCSGDRAAARPLLEKAVALRPEAEDFQASFFSTRLALGEFDALEKEIRQRLIKEPESYLLNMQLIMVLAAQDKRAAADALLTAYERLLPVRAREISVPVVRNFLLYQFGDFTALEKSAARDLSPAGRSSLFFALIEQGRLAEATRLHPLNELLVEDPYHFLTVSVAFKLAGDNSSADAWRERGRQLLVNGDRGDARAAALLRMTASELPAALDDLVIGPKPQSILLTVLAQMHPEKAAALNAAARQLNFDRSYPFHLVRRVTATP